MNRKVVLEGANVITGKSGEIIENARLVLDGNIIESVQKAKEPMKLNEGMDFIKMDGMTIMPGLIDTHIHLVGNGEVSVFVNLFESSMKRAIKSVRYMRNLLEMGITTVRSGGDGNNFFEMALRDSINEGFIEGPRFFATGYHLTATGGHAYFLPPWTDESNCVGLRCDGPDEFRKFARMQIAYGADSIKLTSGKGLEEPEDARIPELTVDEMKVAVEEAHKRGKLVIAHAMGVEAIMNAIEAGVDSIVHGFWMDDACADKMIKKGIYWEPTIRYAWRIAEDGGESGTPDFYVKKCNDAVEALQKNFLRFVKSGLKVTLGTDAGGVPIFYHGENGEELEYMVRLGMSSSDAIIASTKHSAECLRISDYVGTIEPGKEADLLVLEGNPLNDIKIIACKKNIKAVFKGGKRVVWKID
jgi:imidazolonepropionase-like amidohydrolase